MARRDASGGRTAAGRPLRAGRDERRDHDGQDDQEDRERDQRRQHEARRPATGDSTVGSCTGRGRRSRAGAGHIGSPKGRTAGPDGASGPTTLSGGPAAGAAAGLGFARGRAKELTSTSVACTRRRSCSTQRGQLRRWTSSRAGPGGSSASSSRSEISRSARSHQPLPGRGNIDLRSALRARASASPISVGASLAAPAAAERVVPTSATSAKAVVAGSSSAGSRPITCRTASSGSTGPGGRAGTGRSGARSIDASIAPGVAPLRPGSETGRRVKSETPTGFSDLADRRR